VSNWSTPGTSMPAATKAYTSPPTALPAPAATLVVPAPPKPALRKLPFAQQLSQWLPRPPYADGGQQNSYCNSRESKEPKGQWLRKKDIRSQEPADAEENDESSGNIDQRKTDGKGNDPDLATSVRHRVPAAQHSRSYPLQLATSIANPEEFELNPSPQSLAY